MAKGKKPNEIREEVRKQMSAKYKQDIERLKQRANENWNSYRNAMRKLREVSEENVQLKEQLEAQKDWIERLMEFVDLPDEERRGAVQKYVESRKASEDLKCGVDLYFKMFNRLFTLY